MEYKQIFGEEPDDFYYVAKDRQFYIKLRNLLRSRITKERKHIRKGIKFIGHYNTTGYGIACRGYIHALFLAGYDVTFEPLGDKIPIIEDEILFYCYRRKIEYDTIIIHAVPNGFEKYIEKGKKMIGITVWEADLLPTQWIDTLHKMDEIIVPCEWNKQVFQKFGRNDKNT